MDRLPIREGITSLTYHRQPTQSEIRFGHGATHYRDFSPEECCWFFCDGRVVAKRWFVSRDDGLRYYR